MATVREIAAKATELDTATDQLAEMQARLARLRAEDADVARRIAAHQALITRLSAELKTMAVTL